MASDDQPGTPRSSFRYRFQRLLQGESGTEDVLTFLLLTFGSLAVAALLLWPILSLLLQVRQGIVNPASVGSDRGADLRNLALTFAATASAPFIIWRAVAAHWQASASLRQAKTSEQNRELTERRNLTDVFAKAGEMLAATRSNNKPAVEQRLGGIYTLEQLARNSKDQHTQIMEVLCAYIRANAPAKKVPEWPGAVIDRLRLESAAGYGDEVSLEYINSHPDFIKARNGADFTAGDFENDVLQCLDDWLKMLIPPREDIRAALDVIGRRTENQRALERSSGYNLDLRDTGLQRADLKRKHLEGAIFEGARQAGTTFSGAHLQGACFNGVQLLNARFDTAQLHDVGFKGSTLIETKLNWSFIFGTKHKKVFSTRGMSQSPKLAVQRSGLSISQAHLPKADIGRCFKTASVMAGSCCRMKYRGPLSGAKPNSMMQSSMAGGVAGSKSALVLLNGRVWRLRVSRMSPLHRLLQGYSGTRTGLILLDSEQGRFSTDNGLTCYHA